MRSKKIKEAFIKFIEEKWINSDERFGQFLINNGIITDSPFNWNAEISEYPLPHKEMRKIQHWGTYGKSGKEEYKEIPIRDLDKDHIKMILKTQTHLSENLKEILKKEQGGEENAN